MPRGWPVWLVFLLFAASQSTGRAKPGAAAFETVEIQGQLADTDPRDWKRDRPCKLHRVPLPKGRTFVIDMVSKAFDTYLRLEDPAGHPLAENDDSNGTLNSQIIFTPTVDGDFQIVATTFNGQVGPYLLRVHERK